MPQINVAQFLAEAQKVNTHLGRFVKSSLEPIMKELGSQPMVNVDATKLAKLQELIHALPTDSFTKYALALNVLKQGGLFLVGKPVEPTMDFVRFDTGEFMYVGLDHQRKDKLETLNPGSLHHVFDFKWKSSTGNLKDLDKVATREFVKFRTSQQSPPFNDIMPTDMQFYWGESDSAATGFGRDDHSIKPPRLVCRFPWTAAENVAEQWYQYSLDSKRTWHNIPGAAYLLVKGVRQNKAGQWVFFFRKCNWAPHNTKHYNFEVEYLLGAPLAYQPKPGQKWNRTNGTKADISAYGRLISAR